MVRSKTVKPFVFGVLAIALSAACNPGHASVVGGFDAARGGQDSFSSSFGFLIPIIQSAFPGTTFSETSTLNPTFLSNVDVLFLGSVKSGAGGSQMAVNPLSGAEQTAMVNFVLGGGSALLFVDNSDFAAGNNSFISPFGVTVSGAITGGPIATVTNPPAHPTTNGPFGIVSIFQTGVPGASLSLGPNAVSLATLSVGGGIALAVIDLGVLGPGSGGVVVVVDTNVLESPHINNPAIQNRELVLNALAFGNLDMDTDTDNDGVADSLDNCPTVFNPGQEQTGNNEGGPFGDACVDPSVRLPDDLNIGANPIIGAKTKFGSGVTIGDNFMAGTKVMVSKDVTLGDNVTLGDKTKIEKNAILGSDCTLGEDVKIKSDVVIGDRCQIGDNTIVEEGAMLGDDVTLGNNVTIGAGVNVGNNVTVGDGITVSSDLPDGTTLP